MRPATDAVPKVLLPIGLKPMLLRSIEEAMASGVENIAVICSPSQPAVAAYVAGLERDGTVPSAIRVHLVEQPQAAGIGEGLLRCRSLTADQAFGVIVPDNWFVGAEPALAAVAATYARTGLDSIGLVRVAAADAALLGNVGGVELEALDPPDFRIRRLADKADGEFPVPAAGAAWRGVARYVVSPRFYEALEETGPPASGEWDDVPAFQLMIRTTGLAGAGLEASLFDVGQPPGYLAAMKYCSENGY